MFCAFCHSCHLNVLLFGYITENLAACVSDVTLFFIKRYLGKYNRSEVELCVGRVEYGGSLMTLLDPEPDPGTPVSGS